MRKLLACLVIGALAVGCGNPSGTNKKSTSDSKKQTPSKTQPSENGLSKASISLPTPSAVNVQMGKDGDATVKVDRKGGYKGEITLKFKAPEGSGLSIADATVPENKDEVKVTIKVDAKAKSGTFKIEVTAMAKDENVKAPMPATLEVTVK